jgi:hypothetical protein
LVFGGVGLFIFNAPHVDFLKKVRLTRTVRDGSVFVIPAVSQVSSRIAQSMDEPQWHCIANWQRKGQA